MRRDRPTFVAVEHGETILPDAPRGALRVRVVLASLVSAIAVLIGVRKRGQ